MLPEIEQRVRFLKQVQIFNELSESDLARVADHLKQAEYQQGEVIFSQGDEGDNMYFVVSGKVRVTRFDEDTDQDLELAIFDTADVFGEDALFYDRDRSATVTAFGDVVLYFLDSDDFDWLVETFPQVVPYLETFAVTHDIAQRLHLDWLGEGEFINLMTRRHPIRLFGELISILFAISLLITILLLLSIFLSGLESVLIVLWIIGGGFSLLGIGALIWAWMEWRNDYFIVTNVRVVWRERILFRGTSRQETPLHAIQSLNVQTGSFIARTIKVGDLIVRTHNSELHMTDVHRPGRMKDLIQGIILRSRRRSEREQLADIRRTIRRHLGIKKDEIPSEEPETVPPVVVTKYGRFALFKTRIVEGDTITYRKHWSIFVRNAWMQNLFLFGSFVLNLILVIYMFANQISGAVLFLGLGILLTFSMFLWWLYEYEDWRNDLYRVTNDLIIDRDKKPFGQESSRSAPIKNIQSLGHEVPSLMGLILNVGNVSINVGDETFKFIGVHDPSVVHRDISRRMEELVAEQERQRIQQEHERMATWLEIYHEETEDQRFPWRNQEF